MLVCSVQTTNRLDGQVSSRCLHRFPAAMLMSHGDSQARHALVHSKNLYRPAVYPRQVDMVPRVGGLPCLACKRFNSLSKKTYKKLAFLGQLGLPGSSVRG